MAFVFPTNRELSLIAPEKIARLTEDREGFKILPIRDVMAAIVQWEQMDNYFGLQQLRGLDGSPTHVKNVGSKLYSYTPGVYGEFMTVTETELNLRAGSIQVDVPIQVGDLVSSRQDQLLGRELDRMEQIIWTLLTTGTFSVSLPGGQIGFTDTFTLQTYAAGVAWGTVATATPLADFRAVRLLGRGKGTRFDASATAYANSTTVNSMLANANANDLGGKKIAGGNTPNSLEDFNSILTRENAPTLKEYDEGYYNDSNAWVPFIPDNKLVVVGRPPAGQKIGEYVKTMNAVNPMRAPGSYSFVIDRANGINGEKRVPPNLEVHQGHNGGPILLRPGSIVVMSV